MSALDLEHEVLEAKARLLSAVQSAVDDELHIPGISADELEHGRVAEAIGTLIAMTGGEVVDDYRRHFIALAYVAVTFAGEGVGDAAHVKLSGLVGEL